MSIASGRFRPAHVIAPRPYSELAAALDASIIALRQATQVWRRACQIASPIAGPREVNRARVAHAAAERAWRVAAQAAEDGGDLVAGAGVR